MNEFKYNCSRCNREILYKYEKNYLRAIQNKQICSHCSLGKGIFKRNCPGYNCNKELTYKREWSYKHAIELGIMCSSCNVKKSNERKQSFKRNCPKCDKDILYRTTKGLDYAEKNNRPCRSCWSKDVGNRPEVKKQRSNSSKGKKNPRKGKTYFEYWKEQFGEEVAEQKREEMHIKYSIMTSGENNPMYGKERPVGAGNGISGHYKSHYFRSLLELSYLMYLLSNKIDFESAEKKKYRIPYLLDGIKKTYAADFYLIETNQLIEIKPKRLTTTKQNIEKFKVAKEIYKEKYKVLTEHEIDFIDSELLFDLYIRKEIIFTNKSELKVKKFFDI